MPNQPIQLTLIEKDRISTDTIEACRQLLASATAGEITGIIFGAVVKDGRYLVNSAGTLHSNPTLARGIGLALDDELAGMVHKRATDTLI